MRVSVVIPAYNEEEFIGSCLDHIMRQTRMPDEVIVVDNNSQDRTAEIVSQYPVRLIPETNQGMIPARDCGFDAATGDIIIRTDADSRANADWVERIVEHFSQGTIDAVSGPFCFYDMPGRTDTFFCNVFIHCMEHCIGKTLMVGSNFALRKEMWNAVREMTCSKDRLVHEDFDLALNIQKIKGTVRWDNRLVMPASARRIRKNPLSFFGEYPVRLATTCVVNSHLPEQISKTKRTLTAPVRKIRSQIRKKR